MRGALLLPDLAVCRRMVCSENRFPLFRIVLCARRMICTENRFPSRIEPGTGIFRIML